MAAAEATTTTASIKTTATTTTTTATTAAERRAEQSSRQAAGVWSSATHAKWKGEVGWTSTWPRLWPVLTVPLSVCLSVFPISHPPACRSSAWSTSPAFCLFDFAARLIIHLPACPPPRIPSLIHPGAYYLCASLRPSSRDYGGGWEEEEEEEEEEEGMGGLVKRQPGNSPQRLSLKPPLLHLTLCPGSPDKPTNTHTHTHPHKCTHKRSTQDKPPVAHTPATLNPHGHRRRGAPSFMSCHKNRSYALVHVFFWMHCERVPVWRAVCLLMFGFFFTPPPSPPVPEAGAGVTSLERVVLGLLCRKPLCECVFVRGSCEVEHQWEGTDGSLISKLETKMINTSGHSCLPWERQRNETLLAPPRTYMCVLLPVLWNLVRRSTWASPYVDHSC